MIPGPPGKIATHYIEQADKLVAKAVLIRKILYPLGLLLSRGTYEAVAQLVEQQTFNLWVLGSIPSGLIALPIAATALFSIASSMFMPASSLRTVPGYCGPTCT